MSFFNDDWFLCGGTAKCVPGTGTTIIEIRDYVVPGGPEGEGFLRVSSGSPTRVVGFGAFLDHGTTDPLRFSICFSMFDLSNRSTTYYFGKVFSHEAGETVLMGKKRSILEDGTVKAMDPDDWTANRPTA